MEPNFSRAGYEGNSGGTSPLTKDIERERVLTIAAITAQLLADSTLTPNQREQLQSILDGYESQPIIDEAEEIKLEATKEIVDRDILRLQEQHALFLQDLQTQKELLAECAPEDRVEIEQNIQEIENALRDTNQHLIAYLSTKQNL